jgi:uncharacterized protein (DUF2126 family)
MTNIVDFKSALQQRDTVAFRERFRTLVREELVEQLGRSTERAERQPTRRETASRKRNPIRHTYAQAGLAITVAGKLHRGEPLRRDEFLDEAMYLRTGAEAAHRLAAELDYLVKQLDR